MRFRTIKSRILCFMLLLSVIPLILLGIISYQVSKKTMVQQVVKIHEYNIDTYNKNIGIIFENLQKATGDFAYGKDADYLTGKMVSILEKDNMYYKNMSIYKQYELIQVINKDLEAMIPNSLQIQKVILDNRRGFRYLKDYAASKESLSVADADAGDYEELYQKALLSKGKEIFAANETDSFLYMKVIYSLKSFAPEGYLLLTVNNSILEKTMPSGDELEDIAYVVVDTVEPSKQEIVFSAGMLPDMEHLITEYYRGGLEMNHVWNVGKTTNLASGWDILYIADRNALAENAASIKTATFLMISISLLVVGILSIWISRLINRPLFKLKSAIRKVGEEGNYVITEQFGEDEIGRIGNEFKQMVEQNLTLKDSLYQTEIRQKEAELIALQAQMNPHFLYNTLDAIYLMTQMGRSKEAGEMTLALSEIFKLSLNKGQEFTKVREEMKHIQNYLYIQKMRYGDKLKFTLNIAEEILDDKMLKLVLQPIIENAIYHGLEPKAGQGSLTITGRQEEQYLLFVISDNGVGMEHEEWKTGYGLSNVRKRIKLYYGEEYDIQVDSTPGKGTIMKVRLPIELESKKWNAFYND